MKWKLEKLSELCEINVGKTPSRNKQEYFGEGVTWVSIADMNRKVLIESSKEEVTTDGIKSANMKIVDTNTVLFSFKLSVGKVCITAKPVYTNEAIAALPIIDNNRLFTKYLYYAMQAQDFSYLGETAAKGLTLNKAKLNTIQIPLPPLPTQQKIAAILDEADALRRKDKALLAKYDELLQAVFYDMFGDPVKNEKGWEILTLGDVLIDIVAGSSYGGEQRELNADELGVLKISAVTSGEFKNTEYKAIAKSIITKEIISPKKNDLLFSRANTREAVGAMCIVDNDYPSLFLPDKLWRLDLDTARCNVFYIKNLSSVPNFKETLSMTATGTSGSMLNISMNKLRELKIPLPSIETQNKFAAVAQNVQQQKSQIIQQQTYSESLFQSLMQQAFKGDLVE